MKIVFLILLILYAQLIAQNELILLTSVHGEKEGDRFTAVDAIGDVNGDGYADFIVGGNSSGEYVKLYFGGSPFDTLNCIKFLQDTRKRVYASGCGRGDLNGDGYNDFIINTMYDVDDYRVEIYLGGKDKKIYDRPDLTITNNGWYYYFRGKSITGDLNGDGYDDLVITAPNDDYDARGRIYIYFGGQDMNTNVDVCLEGKPWDNLGNSASIVGDVNGDGFDDLLIGAPQLVKTHIGKAYLFFGGMNIGFNNCLEFLGDSTARGYGKIVSGLCDINSDGFKDFGIASQNYVDIILGAQKITNNISFRHRNNEFWYLGSLNDINQDGYDDYVITDKNVNIYLGENNPDTIPNIKTAFWGYPVCSVADINKDGKKEIAVGYSYGESPSGLVNIYSFDNLSSVIIQSASIPSDFTIKQNYPNPFNQTTIIQYNLYKELEITIDIVNLTGRKIKTLFSGQQIPGIHSIVWNGTDTNNLNVASGIYFLRFATKSIRGNYSRRQETMKMVLMK